MHISKIKWWLHKICSHYTTYFFFSLHAWRDINWNCMLSD
ncbi:hypothetical protein HMPREF3232_01198 [Fannyhessea vaginae]|nr:hypothetical protein HMPREF3232_01198 [Fannyhessea vaginae]